MKLLLIVAVLLTAGATAAPHGDRCRYGPSFWCRSIQAATSCNAFTHCLQTVWERQLIDVQQTDVCLSSQESVETARRMRSVDGKIQGPLVTSLCNNADDEPTKQQCQDTVSEFLPQVLSLLESSMEPSSVAALLGLCQLYEDEPAAPAGDTAGSETNLCQDCHAFLRNVKEVLNRPRAEEEIATVMGNGVCSHFGDLEIWCKAVAEIGVPRLFKFLEENDGAEMLCGLSAICEESEDRKLKRQRWSAVIGQIFSEVEMDTESDVICHDCEKVLTSILNFEKESSSRMSVEHAFTHLCSLTSLNEETCRLLSEGFSRIPEEFLHEASLEVNVPSVCRSMIGCTGSESSVSQSPESPTDQHPPEVPQTPRCTECLRVFEDVLSSESSVSQVIAQAKHILCQKTGSREEQCSTMVDVFLPMTIDWLTTNHIPQLVCSQLTTCPSPKDMKTLDFVKLFGTTWQPNTLAQLGSFECDVCNVVVEEARAAFRNPSVQTAVVNLLDDVCNELGQEASKCKNLVKQYAPDLFELLVNELDPTVVCEMLLKCTKPEQETAETEEETVPQTRSETVWIGQGVSESEPGSQAQSGSASQVEEHLMKKMEKAVEDTLKQKVEGSLECNLCHLLMEKLDNTIADNNTELQAKLNQLLGEVCDLLPSADKEACEKFADTYSPVIVHLLLQQLDPHMICNELGLCDDAEAQQVPAEKTEDLTEEEVTEDAPQKEEKEELPREAIECELCRVIVDSLDKIISQNKTEAAVQKALDEVCQVIPENVQSQCLSFVDQYASVVVELLLQELRPQPVCAVLQLCQQDREAAQEGAVDIALPEIKENKPAQKTGDVNTSHSKKQTGNVSDEEVCLVCQTLGIFLREAMREQSTQDVLETLLDDICVRLPDNLTSACDVIVSQYTPLILQLLGEKINPLDLCQAIKLCLPGAHEGRLEIKPLRDEVNEGRLEDGVFGEDPCTYGPTFWCSSMDNAHHCGMVRECVEKYGMKP